MKLNGFNISEFFYYKKKEGKVSFIVKYVMDRNSVEDRDNIQFKQEEYEKVNMFTDTMIAVGRKYGLFSIY